MDFNGFDISEPPDLEEECRVKVVACGHCKSENVAWKNVEGKWKLFTDGKPHVCSRKKVACKHCNSEDVKWVKCSEGWRLFTNDKVHECPGIEKTSDTMPF